MTYAASKAYISNHLEGLNQRFVHADLPSHTRMQNEATHREKVKCLQPGEDRID